MNILIVAHDTELAALTGKLLERRGYCVTCCGNSLDAHKLLKDKNIRLVIADLETDEKERLLFCKSVKSTDNPPKLLYIGKSSEEEIPALNAGADDWIKKPYKTAVFLARTSALMRRTKQKEGSNLI